MSLDYIKLNGFIEHNINGKWKTCIWKKKDVKDAGDNFKKSVMKSMPP